MFRIKFNLYKDSTMARKKKDKKLIENSDR